MDNSQKTFTYFIGFVGLVLFAAVLLARDEAATSKKVSAQVLYAEIQSKTAPTILDVRSSWEFSAGHIPGARNVPFWRPARLARFTSARDAPLIVCCGLSARVGWAGWLLRQNGFTQLIYTDATIADWRVLGYPLEQGPSTRYD